MTDKVKLYVVKNNDGKCLKYNPRIGAGLLWDGWSGIHQSFITDDEDRANLVADGNSGHVVTLIEEQKVKLPREVGEELDDYKRGFEHDIDVLDLLTDVDNLSELLKTHKWLYNSDGERSEHANRLIDAYRYGWEAEPEAKWYVQTPKEWWEKPDAPEYMNLDQIGIVSGIGSKKLAGKFTRAELKQYHLDSDIFTLVPVGEDK